MMADSKSQALNSIRGFHSWKWSQACNELQKQGDSFVLLTVIGASGSVPRGSGTKMVVTRDDIYDTIGGGRLEFKAIQEARALLVSNESTQILKQFPLGADLGQCCGGSVNIMFECIINQNLKLDMYGAGHIAHSLISILANLPIKVRWIDQRAELFPDHLPSNVVAVVDPHPVDQVADASPESAQLILTHNHQLDFELVEAILKRDDYLWLGLIGSDVKAKRFRNRLAHKNFSAQQINSIHSPVGLSQVPGKLPMEVAVSIAGQLIQLYQKDQQSIRQGLQWREIKQVIKGEPV